LVVIEVVQALRKREARVAVAHPGVRRSDVASGALTSRTGARLAATAFQTAAEIRALFRGVDIVVVDEVQFIPEPLQNVLVSALEQFVTGGGWVIMAGLQYTSARAEFPLCAYLKEMAVVVFALTATCVVCKRHTARYSQRLIEGAPAPANTPHILPPSVSVRYEPRCADCHQSP
jgi:thymidine kinase